MSLDWSHALAWRLGRHLLDPVGRDASVLDVVTRLGAMPAFPQQAAEQAVGVRRVGHRTGDVAAALADGMLLKAYAFRGATHLMAPAEGGRHLALRAGTRMWERASWQEFYRLTPADWPALRAAVREALADGQLTRAGLAAAVTAHPRFSHLGPAITDGADTLLKPLCWQGDLCLGAGGGETTFRAPGTLAGWAGVPDEEEAGPLAVEDYVRGYGPVTPEQVHYWLGSGLGVRSRRLRSWIDGLGDRLVEVRVAGEPRLMHRDDVDGLMSTAATGVVRLLPAYDQWLLGPGTADPHVVPPARRAAVSRGAAVLVAGGVVAGTWTLRDDTVRVDRWAESGPHHEGLDAEVDRLGEMLGRSLSTVVGSG